MVPLHSGFVAHDIATEVVVMSATVREEMQGGVQLLMFRVGGAGSTVMDTSLEYPLSRPAVL